MEIGIDIEKNDRFKNLSEKQLKEIFSEQEINYAKKFLNFHEHLCAFWCVKEAFVKATKNQKVEFLKIETMHNSDGSPYISFNDEIKLILKNLNCSNVKISISHTSDFSTAVCLIF